MAEIVSEVAQKGDRALIAFAKKFDGASLTAKSLKVTDAELEMARNSVSRETKDAIKSSLKNIHSFAAQSLRKNWKAKNPQGVEVGERFVPFDRVGVYVPGGKAPLVSTSLMTAGFAQAAGVPEIVAATPPGRDGRINFDLLYALEAAGATALSGGNGSCRNRPGSAGTGAGGTVAGADGPNLGLCLPDRGDGGQRATIPLE